MSMQEKLYFIVFSIDIHRSTDSRIRQISKASKSLDLCGPTNSAFFKASDSLFYDIFSFFIDEF